jgi:hypothetical protein
MEKFNESLPVDKRMWKEDIEVGWACGYWQSHSPTAAAVPAAAAAAAAGAA